MENCKGTIVNHYYCCRCDGNQENNGSNNNTNAGTVPVGTIIYAHILQQGYVKANGQLLDLKDYPELYKFANDNQLLLSEVDWSNGMQGMYGEGDGCRTFRVPDLRGQFLRGLDDEAGVDADRIIGSTQGDAIRNIIGNLSSNGGACFAAAGGTLYLTGQKGIKGSGTSNNDYYDDFYFDASRVVPTAEENRPKNIALIAQIKY